MDTRPLPDRISSRAHVDALLAAATNYEEKRPRDPLRKALDLDRVRALLASVGDPQVGPRTVHVAGSKGKGTTARLIAAGLGHAGRAPVGLYTSPHLEDLAERIEVDGARASENALARAAQAVLPHVRRTRGTEDAPTFFELMTAMAWCVFREAGCTDVVLETGLGGRLDATNVCRPTVTIITWLEREHTRWLGDTIEAIAAEKAGILKAGVPAVVQTSNEGLEVIRERAEAVGAPLVTFTVIPGRRAARPGEIAMHVHVRDVDAPLVGSLPLPGEHLVGNAGAALTALRLLGVDDEVAWAGIARARLPGILERVADTPTTLVDGAHTPRSVEATCAAVSQRWPDRAGTVLLAMLQEKEVATIARLVRDWARRVVVTQVDSPRAIPADELARQVRTLAYRRVEVVPDVAEALGRARTHAGPDGLVLCTGSIYLAGAVKHLLRPRGTP